MKIFSGCLKRPEFKWLESEQEAFEHSKKLLEGDIELEIPD